MKVYRVRTARLDLVPFGPDQALDLHAVMATDAARLAEWLPFALEEPLALEERIARAVERRRAFDAGDRSWILRERGTGALVGGCGLHPRVGPLGVEIGYWLAGPFVGRGYVREAVVALCRLAFVDDGYDRVEIRVDPANARSRAVAERLGFTLEAVLRRRLTWPGGEPRDCALYALFASEWAASLMSRVEVERFDAADRPIPRRAASEAAQPGSSQAR